jgi:hypothetical protein
MFSFFPQWSDAVENTNFLGRKIKGIENLFSISQKSSILEDFGGIKFENFESFFEKGGF